MPVLRKGALPGSDEWFITEMMPGAHPLEELERALMGIAVNADLNLQEQLAKDPFGLLRAAWMALPSKGSELLLVIDQFEELFILVEDENEREHFLETAAHSGDRQGKHCAGGGDAAGGLLRPPADVPGVQRADADAHRGGDTADRCGTGAGSACTG